MLPQQLDEPGSYWYHSHNKGQYPDGLRGKKSSRTLTREMSDFNTILAGPLIVHDPNDPYKGQYDEELVLTTSDWYAFFLLSFILHVQDLI